MKQKSTTLPLSPHRLHGGPSNLTIAMIAEAAWIGEFAHFLHKGVLAVAGHFHTALKCIQGKSSHPNSSASPPGVVLTLAATAYDSLTKRSSIKTPETGCHPAYLRDVSQYPAHLVGVAGALPSSKSAPVLTPTVT